MYIVVVGCGRVGARLATLLSHEGHNVVVIDNNPGAFKRLGDVFNGLTITGVGFDRETLIQAGIERADAFAAVTNGDNTNIMAAEMAKTIFNVPKVVARVYDPERQELYRQLGIDAICSTTMSAGLFRRYLLDNGLKSVGDLPGGVRIVRFRPGKSSPGKRLDDLQADWWQVVGICRGPVTLWPHGGEILRDADELVLALKEEDLPRLRKFFGLKPAGEV